MVEAQDEAHGSGHDYVKGSPHLRHPQLRTMIEARLQALVEDLTVSTGGCRVLEIGAGHGTFTTTLVDAGATVTVTEASAASAAHLREKFANDDRVRIVHDESGEAIFDQDTTWDLAVIVSVLHHIPDYVGFLRRLEPMIALGGAIFTVQDPLYYPRRSRLSHLVSRGSYLLWRVTQGNYARGIATRIRRLRGVYDENEPSDLVEYHVVRQGCDEEAIRQVLEPHFDTEVFTYWSSQGPFFQRAFEGTALRSDFGVAATRHR